MNILLCDINNGIMNGKLKWKQTLYVRMALESHKDDNKDQKCVFLRYNDDF